MAPQPTARPVPLAPSDPHAESGALAWPSADFMADLRHHAQRIAAAVPHLHIEVLARVDSTNAHLMRGARHGLRTPTLVVAHEQTAGQGRQGKSWYSCGAQSLTFSLALSMAPSQWAGLSLAVGVSLAGHLHPAVRLKWPNDLWLHDRKLGGILVQTTRAATREPLVIVGVGINIARPSAHAIAPYPGSVAPAGLSEVLIGRSPGDVLAQIAAPLLSDLYVFQRQGLQAFLPRFAQLDALKGRPIRLSDGTCGTACGVDTQGALQLLGSQGMQSVHSAQVSVRPC